jgi:hypothetical protein
VRPETERDYELAKRSIREYLRDGEWHGSREIHEDLADVVAKDWMFGKVKKELRIEHRQMGGRFYWRLVSARPVTSERNDRGALA